MSDGALAWSTVIALFVVTVLTRGAFLLPRRQPVLRPWLRDAMRHASGAALLALAVPQMGVALHGAPPATWHDARLLATAATCACFAARRSVAAATAVGVLSYLLLRVGAGW